MKIKINTGEEVIEIPNDLFKLRQPIVGEQVRVLIDKKPYKFDVANVLWDFVEGEVLIEVS